MKKNRRLTYRIYPNEVQKEKFCQTFGCCRKVWNLILSERNEYYRKTGKTIKPTPAKYKAEFGYLKDVDSLALANVQLDLEKAFSNFFSNRKHFGRPQFKSRKKNRKSYTTNCVNGNICFSDDDKYVRLPKIGSIRVKRHCLPHKDWKLKSVTVEQKADRYFLSCLYEYEEKVKEHSTGKKIALDYKSDGLYCDDQGNICHMPKFYRESQKRRAILDRSLSRKTYGSKSYRKALLRKQKHELHVANQRKDFLHKLSSQISNDYDTVCIESLNMKAIGNKKMKNGKSTNDNAYGMFVGMLEYKLQDKGHRLVKIDKWFPSSQVCSKCGSIKKIPLKQRTYICECGLVLDRDHNAALNILKEGLRLAFQ